MLRRSLQAGVLNALEKSKFTLADFAVEFPSDGKELLKIEFRHSPSYGFFVWTGGNKLYLRMAPSEYRAQETFELNTLGTLPTQIDQWTRHLREELRSTVPVYDEVDELRERLERHIEETLDRPEERFTQAEGDELRASLAELMERLALLEEEGKLTRQELNRLDEELRTIRANIDTFPRRVWYLTAANKLWSATSKVVTSPEARKVFAGMATRSLGLDPPDN